MKQFNYTYRNYSSEPANLKYNSSKKLRIFCNSQNNLKVFSYCIRHTQKL
ncbi:hypothetical protein SAMN05660463_00400 [Pseudomonas sp. URIL14HWK12:I9]|nr:hypothetical protein F474_01004 [Pseudomonas sp. URIL14HWK12:I12]PVZ27470.1 hypothetical protein F470_00659 [Pseudomonas sp. URIL14HWK12:I10]PVZ38359.1 hypothetical protein F472_01004 [Pseudomonas sp. URIL14HWK12:I11]SNZ03672.1 hypothetical protein SAMN05660463_00400 [Pseudomonas sp. URIL14HWK12:I9]